MSIRSELEAIQEADASRMLRVEAVHAWAKANQQSALHAAIEWDLRAAALSWQLQQIRTLISLHIRTPEHKRETVSLSIDRSPDNHGYRTLAQVVQTPSLRAVLLEDAVADLERLRHKYEEHLPELAPVWAALDVVNENCSPPANAAKCQSHLAV